MKPSILLTLIAAQAFGFTSAGQQKASAPDAVLDGLMAGNARFVAGTPTARDWAAEAKAAVPGQFPRAVVLSCLDSRVPVEAIFDQGIGDVFVARVAGNVVGDQTLGSLEFATKAVGAKVVLVLGHESCGACKGAMSGAKLGQLDSVLDEIKPAATKAVEALPKSAGPDEKLEAVVRANVERAVGQLRARSPILADLEKEGAIRIVGAVYSLRDRKVTLLPEKK